MKAYIITDENGIYNDSQGVRIPSKINDRSLKPQEFDLSKNIGNTLERRVKTTNYFPFLTIEDPVSINASKHHQTNTRIFEVNGIFPRKDFKTKEIFFKKIKVIQEVDYSLIYGKHREQLFKLVNFLTSCPIEKLNEFSEASLTLCELENKNNDPSSYKGRVSFNPPKIKIDNEGYIAHQITVFLLMNTPADLKNMHNFYSDAAYELFLAIAAQDIYPEDIYNKLLAPFEATFKRIEKVFLEEKEN